MAIKWAAAAIEATVLADIVIMAIVEENILKVFPMISLKCSYDWVSTVCGILCVAGRNARGLNDIDDLFGLTHSIR